MSGAPSKGLDSTRRSVEAARARSAPATYSERLAVAERMLGHLLITARDVSLNRVRVWRRDNPDEFGRAAHELLRMIESGDINIAYDWDWEIADDPTFADDLERA